MKLQDVLHERLAEFLHVLLLSLPCHKSAPGCEQVLHGDDMLMFMKSGGLLPVVEHITGVYKLWFAYRDHFPKKSRYTLGDKIDGRFITVLELLFLASYQSKTEKVPTLERALTGIDALKFLLKISWELRLFDDKKYATLSEGLQEAGRQAGAWKKGLQTKSPTA